MSETFQEQRRKRNQKALEASRRLNADKLIHLGRLLREAKVSPVAINDHENHPTDYLLLHMSDLLVIALNAHYEYQEESK